MPRHDNDEQYRHGAYDYRTANEDSRLKREEDNRRRESDDHHRRAMEQIEGNNKQGREQSVGCLALLVAGPPILLFLYRSIEVILT